MIRLAAALALLAAPALAEAPAQSLMPLPRPSEATEEAAQTVVSTRGVMPAGPLRPKPRPEAEASAEPIAAAPKPARLRPATRPPAETEQLTIVRVIRGPLAHAQLQAQPRPPHIDRLVKEQATLSEVKFGRKGSVCGINSIKGQSVSSFGRPGKGCGIANPVQVTSVQGISLSSTATMDCGTAKALDRWVKKGLKPAIGRKGGGVKQIKVVAHYACRNRNNAKSGRLSEHAKGRAVDIAGVTLRDGTYVSVLKGWGSKAWAAALKKMHKAACGPFGTVLGPNANAYHRDHFHFDTARYRSGSYCR
ncbi:extensin family protein [Vannielia litorea]|uniref:extensin-like domain-containing protein n=1 Tax=Vannielia litorea TaxID=1217970 RepID=UPI0021BD9759|nr:extensin family protein [Vannielia litorea]